MKSPGIYLDYAAATPVDRRVFAAMKPYFFDIFGNPSSVHRIGVLAREAVEVARKSVAGLVGARSEGVTFTASTTEAAAVLFHSIAKQFPGKRHAVALSIEHKAIIESLRLAGYEVTLVKVDRYGVARAEDVLSAIRPDTGIVSVQLVNNETGVVQPVTVIGKAIAMLSTDKPVFHSDVSQAMVTQVIDLSGMHLDAVTFSAAKMYGPKGVAALVVRHGVPLAPFFSGGGQERGVRAGTENVPGIVGFGEAARLCVLERSMRVKHLLAAREVFLERLSGSGCVDWASQAERSPHIASIRTPKDAEMLMVRLENVGVFVSAASACTRGESKSHVLQAIGIPDGDLLRTIRVSFGTPTTLLQARRAGKLVAQAAIDQL
ncbi:cysteine desulfurase [Patescibacteria group bacterium]|nr:cysteine desulfurase [Patescibacteria group bacterium]